MEQLGINFGLIIAYLIPGFLSVYTLASFVPPFASLIGPAGIPQAEALIPLLVLGLAVGMIVNAFSWAFLRPLFTLSGVSRPQDLTYTKLRKEDIDLYNTVVEVNFRYHQFYANMLIALLLCGPVWLLPPTIIQNILKDMAYIVVLGVLFMAARDSLKRAYARMNAITTRKEDVP